MELNRKEAPLYVSICTLWSVSDWCLWSRRAICLDCSHPLLPKTEVKHFPSLPVSSVSSLLVAVLWCRWNSNLEGFNLRGSPPLLKLFCDGWELPKAFNGCHQGLSMSLICLFFLLSLFFCVETWVGQPVKHYQISGEQIFWVFWCVTIFFFFWRAGGGWGST